MHRVTIPLPSRQRIFGEFLLPFLRNLEYEGEEVSSYFPLGRERRVIIDRAREILRSQ